MFVVHEKAGADQQGCNVEERAYRASVRYVLLRGGFVLAGA